MPVQLPMTKLKCAEARFWGKTGGERRERGEVEAGRCGGTEKKENKFNFPRRLSNFLSFSAPPRGKRGKKKKKSRPGGKERGGRRC